MLERYRGIPRQPGLGRELGSDLWISGVFSMEHLSDLAAACSNSNR